MMPKSIIAIAIIFLCIVAGTIFFWWPKYKEFSLLKLEIAQSKMEKENKDKYFSELNSVSSKLKEYSSELSKIDSALPTESIVPDLINFLAEKSSQSGLILEKVNLEKISPLEVNSKINKISVSFSLSGLYPSLRGFLSTLQKSAKLIEVDSIMFSEPKQGGAFSFDMRIKTYSY